MPVCVAGVTSLSLRMTTLTTSMGDRRARLLKNEFGDANIHCQLVLQDEPLHTFRGTPFYLKNSI